MENEIKNLANSVNVGDIAILTTCIALLISLLSSPHRPTQT